MSTTTVRVATKIEQQLYVALKRIIDRSRSDYERDFFSETFVPDFDYAEEVIRAYEKNA